MKEIPDVIIFLGRLHALVVHLPIGFLCLAILVELVFRSPKHIDYLPVKKFIWLLAALSSTVSVVLGYFLSLPGGYDTRLLNLHKWSGILLAIFIHICYFSKSKRWSTVKTYTYLQPISVLISAMLLVVTGHYGGSLTHGSDYLAEYAPDSFSDLYESSGRQVAHRKITSLDSADIFSDAVMPIMKARCISCHNSEKKKGELMLDTYQNILKGGENGKIIVPGKPEESEIYRRITLPPDHKDFMPTDGKKPLTKQQVFIIGWWIKHQAPDSGTIADLHPDSVETSVFKKFFNITDANSLDNINAPPADEAVIRRLKEKGFHISPLSEKSNLLKATLSGKISGEAVLKDLVLLKPQLVWLQINNSGEIDESMVYIGKLTNLRKLNLSHNGISDAGIVHLSHLNNLESINLYSTNISDEGVRVLLKLEQIKTIYAGNTRVSPNLKTDTSLPGNKIILTE